MPDNLRAIALQAAALVCSRSPGGTSSGPPKDPAYVLEHADAYLAWLTRPTTQDGPWIERQDRPDPGFPVRR